MKSIAFASAAACGMLALACRAPASDRESVLDEVLRLVDEHFYDPARLDERWQAECTRARTRLQWQELDLSRAINDLLAHLRASHTEFRTRAEPRAYELADVFWEGLPDAARARAFGSRGPRLSGVGWILGEHEGELFVRGVLEGSPAEVAGVSVGERVLACDGEPFHPVESFRGRAGRATRVLLGAPDGTRREITLAPDELRPGERYLSALRASARIVERPGRRLGYVHAWSYAGEQFHEALRELLLEGELAGADGLVLDLRDGLGGANPDAIALFDPELPLLTLRGRDGTERALPSSWRKPVVLLVDGFTTSGKEVLARAFQRAGRGRIVGERTAGAVLGGRVFLLRDGSILYLAVRDVRVDGEALEGTGVTPDVLVPWKRWRGGEDVQLARALELLEEQTSAGP